MKKNYQLVKTLLVAGLFVLQLPANVAAQGFKELLGQGRTGKPATTTTRPNARVAKVLSLHQNSDIYFPDFTGSGWVLSQHGRYTYDAQGNQTSKVTLDPTNQLIYKDSAQFDAQGNETFYAGYQWNSMSSAWEMNYGYRTLYTYNPAGKPTESISQSYDNGLWENSYRQVTLYNPAGFPTEQTEFEWDMNAWAPQMKLVFSYGAATNPPTSITIQEYNNNNNSWTNTAKYINLTWHDFDKFQPLSYEGQIWAAIAWISMQRATITYDAFGGSVGITQDRMTGNWVNANRSTESYDSKMNYIGSKEESWQSNAWVKDYETAEVLTYNSADQITERIYRRLDQMTGLMIDEIRETYSNFRVLSTAKPLAPLSVKVYPNPATDRIQVQVDGTETASATLTDLTGRVVLNRQLPAGAHQELNLSGLAKGTYLLKLETKKGMSIQKIVKQ